MKVSLLSSIFTALIAIVISEEDPEVFTDEEIRNYKDLGIDLTSSPDFDLLDEILRSLTGSRYLLYTRRNPNEEQQLKINNENSIINSNFNPEATTVVIVHGWLGNQYSKINSSIRKALFDISDVNVIIVDWSRLSHVDYVTATAGVPTLGRFLGQFLNYLQSVSNASFDNMHLVGHSLGAHLVGIAGRELGGQVARITGLDPAGPSWNLNVNRLKSSDAIYVEAIHTNAAVFGLGLGALVGDVDFFPNGGKTQPGCVVTPCSHNRAFELFASSITNKLVGTKCSSLEQMSLNKCMGETYPMGNNDLKKSGAGIYRLNTGSRHPF